MTIVMVVSILDVDVGDALPYYRRLEYEIPESTAAMIYLCLMGIMQRYSSFIQEKICLVVRSYKRFWQADEASSDIVPHRMLSPESLNRHHQENLRNPTSEYSPSETFKFP